MISEVVDVNQVLKEERENIMGVEKDLYSNGMCKGQQPLFLLVTKVYQSRFSYCSLVAYRVHASNTLISLYNC